MKGVKKRSYRITLEEIKVRLWNGANELRGSMDASRYKDYMLSLMFYKFLSDQTLKIFAIIAGIFDDKQLQRFRSKKNRIDKTITLANDARAFFILWDD